MKKRFQKAVLGVLAGMCLVAVSQLTIAGAVSCPSGNGNADCTQLNKGFYSYHYEMGDFGVFALLTKFDRDYDNDRAPAWGYAMKKVRALHSYLFEGFMMDFGKPNNYDPVDKPTENGSDYPNGEEPPVASISEPGTFALFGLGLLAFGVTHLRRRTRNS